MNYVFTTILARRPIGLLNFVAVYCGPQHKLAGTVVRDGRQVTACGLTLSAADAIVSYNDFDPLGILCGDCFPAQIDGGQA